MQVWHGNQREKGAMLGCPSCGLYSRYAIRLPATMRTLYREFKPQDPFAITPTVSHNLVVH